MRTVSPPERTIALTFDDGPDPVWTPRILDVLKKHRVHATFFVVGSAATDNPDVVRRIVAEGHEIGLHTLTHTDLGTAGQWQRELEVEGAQDTVVGITGQAVSLLRPPFSSENGSVTDGTWSAMKALADQGYLTVLSSLDSGDWRQPGVNAIEGSLAAAGREGEVVLMHDGGGARDQTVAALDAALSRYSDQGYRVTTVGDAVGIDSMRPASAAEQASGWAFMWGVRLSGFVVRPFPGD